MSYNPRCDAIVRKWLDTIVKDKTKITSEEINFIVKKGVSRDELKKCIDFFKINGEPEINLPIEPYKIPNNSDEWNAAREGALQSASLENADEVTGIQKTKQNSKKSEAEKAAKAAAEKAAEDKAIEKAQESADDLSDLFPELEVVFIGKRSFDKEQIIKNFGPIDGFLEGHLVALLKKVFQNKYPITRSHGLPKIPSKENDKKLLLKALYNYFNKQRIEIIKNRKQQGNSMMLRESIGHLDEIKMLIEHFEQDKAKFPYHLFREYMSDAQYYSNEGDLNEQVIKLKRKKHSEDHVKNLLRQFAKIYLINQGKGNLITQTKADITVGGPGVTREDFERFRETQNNIPPIISSLIDLLEGNTKSLEDSGEEVSYSNLMDVIKRLDSEFTTIKDDNTPEGDGFASPQQKGGNKIKESEEALIKLVNKIFEDYKVLKTRERAKITTTQGEMASIEATNRELTELRNKLKEAEAKTQGLDPNTILELDKELTRTKKLLAVAQPQVETLIAENMRLKELGLENISTGNKWKAAYDALQTEIATLKAKEVEYKNENGKVISTEEYGKQWKEAYEEMTENKKKCETRAKELEEKEKKLIAERNTLKAKDVEYKNENGKPLTNENGKAIDAVQYGKRWKEAYDDLEKKEKALELEKTALERERDALKTQVGKIKNTTGKSFNGDEYGNKWKEAYENMKKSQEEWEKYAKSLVNEEENNLVKSYKLFGILTGNETIEVINNNKTDPSLIDYAAAQIKKIMNDHSKDDEYICAKKNIMEDLKITDEQVDKAEVEEGGTQQGGARKLLDYSMKVADNRLNDFLTKQPLLFASLITDFEKSSKLNIVREINEKYILEEFILYQLKQHFKDEKMKEFFYEFNTLFEKMKFHEMINMCFSLYEICNAISKSKEDIDVVRLESKEYNGLLDQIQNLLKSCTFDFYEVASKELLNVKLIDIKYYDKYTYFKPDTKSFEHTYSIDDTLKLTTKSYDYNEEIYTINNKVLYFFFILSAYNIVRRDIKENEIVQTLLKNTRTLKRNHKKSAKVRWQTK